MIVIDANVGVSQVITLPFTPQATACLRRWYRQGQQVLAPALWWYEAVSAVRRAVYLKAIPAEDAWARLISLSALEVQIVAPCMELNHLAITWSERLGQSRAYDSQYAALADRMNAEFWTADQRLVAGLRERGAEWAHWIGED